MTCTLIMALSPTAHSYLIGGGVAVRPGLNGNLTVK